MEKNFRSRVENATVKVLNKRKQRWGQGVLVESGFIVTASHCLQYNERLGLKIKLGFHILYTIESKQGDRFRLSPVVIESSQDVAVLGPLDCQTNPEESEPYDSFCDRTKPVPLFRKRLTTFPAEFRVHVLTHNKGWVEGKATVYRDCHPVFWLEAEENIDGGTSGGPIVNDRGELVGIVSTAGGPIGTNTTGFNPFLRWALPSWAYLEICGCGSTAKYHAWARKEIEKKYGKKLKRQIDDYLAEKEPKGKRRKGKGG